MQLYLPGAVDDGDLQSLARLPGVSGFRGIGELSVRWKPALDAEWQTAAIIALDDYARQQSAKSLIFMGEGLPLGVISWLQAIPLSALAGQAFVEMIGRVIDFPAQCYYSFDGVWLWLGIVTVLSLVASWLPAYRATQIRVRESLAYE
jgi:hypothetical protein